MVVNDQLKDELPIKWKKHLILSIFGFKTIKELNSQIKRYKTSEFSRLVEDIRDNMELERGQGGKSLYIVSLVSMNQIHKLPNIIIQNDQNLIDFKNSIKSKELGQYSEVWFCKKKINQKTDNIVGRIAFQDRDSINSYLGMSEQTIEQVWNCSHRVIEKFNENTENICLMASRDGWHRRYNIEKIHIPNDMKVDKNKIVNQFVEIVKEIERNKDKIEVFADYFKKLGVEVFNLEYMSEGGNFSFIDWDSSDDLKVINSLFKPKNFKEQIR